MARPLWSGSIQISLVGFAVEIYPATNTTKPFTFHEVDRQTMTRVRRQSVSSGPAPSEESVEPSDEPEEAPASRKTALHIAPQGAPQGTSQGAPQTASQISSQLSSLLQGNRSDASAAAEHAVDRADIVKGYEYEKGKYAIIEPAELKNLRLAGKKTIEISQFSKAAEIDPILYEKPYLVMPKAGPQATAFAVVRQALRESGMVGVGEIVFSGRQHLMTLAPPLDPNQSGMMLYTLRFAGELRDAREYAQHVEIPATDPAQLKLAMQLIDAYTQPFDVHSFKDHYEEALRELVEAKMNNLPAPTPAAEPKPGKVIDLMEALRKSLLQKKPVQSAGASAKEAAPTTAGNSTSATGQTNGGEKKTKASRGSTAAARKSKSA